jgi:potassium-transporting ATPase potassium-binding subunit
MTTQGWLQISLFFLLILLSAKPLGLYMEAVMEGRRTWLSAVLLPVERMLYRICGVRRGADGMPEEQHWTRYAGALLAFSAFSAVLLYTIQRLQIWFPFNPLGLSQNNVSPDSAFNTAVSFTTNTNWQSYVPESTLSYFVQMAGLTVHNFVSAAAGIAIAIALVRGFARHSVKTIGNFWADLTRSTLYILLPISIVVALVLCSQGVIQNLSAYTNAVTLEGAKQTIAQGPVASQEAIKMLGTNGGGFFNANSAHPFENPTPLSNFVEMFSIFLIPAGFTATLGRLTGSPRHGWAVFAAMAVLFFAGVLVAYSAESKPNPLFHGVDQHASVLQAGGNMEGKEVRFGIANSALFATVTTDASCGAVNSMHDSFMPLGGLVPLTNILLGEIIFGGVGAGMYGMLIFVILAVFIAGLMVGRTPEYLGKKIQAYDVQMSMLYVLIFPLSILALTAASLLMPQLGLSSLSNRGPHGLSEILYAYTSATGNNGSAFMGLNVNTHWYNLSIGMAMLIGRFLMIIPMLAVAGNLAQKKSVPASQGTFPVHTPLFTVLLVGVILIVGALTFFPALSLGPILEHLLLHAGRTF